MSPQTAATRSFVKQAALLLICLAVSAGDAAASDSKLLLLIPPVLAAAKQGTTIFDPKSWGTATTLFTNDNVRYYEGAISNIQFRMGSAGHALLAWESPHEVIEGEIVPRIFAKRYTTDLGWSSSEKIQGAPENEHLWQSDTHIIGTDDELLLVWNEGQYIPPYNEQGHGERECYSIWSKSYSNGIGRSSELVAGEVAPCATGNSSSQLIKAASRFILYINLKPVYNELNMDWGVTYEEDGPTFKAWSKYYGINWGSAELFDDSLDKPSAGADKTVNLSNDYHPDGNYLTYTYIDYLRNQNFAANDTGNALIVYDRFEADKEIGLNAMQRTLQWGEHYHLQDVPHSGDINDQKIVMDTSGNALLVWKNAQRMWMKKYIVGIGWEKAQPINESDELLDIMEFRIAMNSNGDAMLIYIGSHRLLARRYNATTGWGEPQVITDTPIALSNRSDIEVSININGIAMVVWNDDDNMLWSNRYVPGKGWWRTPKTINSNTTGYVSHLNIGIDSAGRALAVWQSVVDGKYSIQSNRFE